MERVMEEFEHRCHENMTHAMETEEGLGIEYDEDVVCDVCQSPDGEDNNEMVFCDKCNICVHQVRGHPQTDVNFTRCAPNRCVSPPGLLRHSEGPKGQLALPDLCPRHPTKMPVVSQEGWRHEADPEWNQVGPRQLCLVDSRGEEQTSLLFILLCSGWILPPAVFRRSISLLEFVVYQSFETFLNLQPFFTRLLPSSMMGRCRFRDNL